MEEVVNVKIIKTELGYEEHGVFTCWVLFEADGWGGGFGGYRLDMRDQDSPLSYGLEFIKRIVGAVGVDSWEHLVGSHARVKLADGKTQAIGHIVQKKWFSPEDIKNLLTTGVNK